jgi:pilus assembly protein CpaC
MKRPFALLVWGITAIFSGLACSGMANSQQLIEPSAYGGAALWRIALAKGQSVIVDLPQDAAEVFVADPKIANALVRPPHKLYLIGVDGGQTSVFVLDHDGRKIAAYELGINIPPPVLVDIAGLRKTLRAVIPGAAVSARLANGTTIILTGSVDSAEEAQQAIDIAKAFRAPAPAPNSQGAPNAFGAGSQTNVNTPIVNYAPANQSQAQDTGGIINLITIRGRAQVMLKVTVAEVGREVAKQLGITTSSLTASWGTFTQFNPFAIHGTIAQNLAGLPPALPLQTTMLTGHNPDNTLSATLQAFERYGVSRILAEPTVSAVSGESARLTVGGEIPIPGPSICQGGGCTGGGAIFQPYGVTLKFTPTVLSEGRIELHLATEVTEIDTQTGQTVFGTFVPGLLTRKNDTVVEIPSGGSIASAGLLQTLSRQAINGLPGLLDLPVLGALFRSRDYQRQETELMIIVTPYIIKPVRANEISKPTDGFADASDPQTWFLGRINRLYASPGNREAIQDYKGPVGFIQD